jgi:hypothetical protein
MAWPAAIAAIVAGLLAVKHVVGRKREQALRNVAQQLGLSFEGEDWSHGSRAPQLETPLFERKSDEQIRNIMSGHREGLAVSFFDYSYGRGRSHTEQTLAAFSQEVWLPSFELGSKSILRGMSDTILHREIRFQSNPDFSKRFRLASVDPEKVRELFTPGMLSFVETLDPKAGWRLEGSGQTLVVYRRQKKLVRGSFLRSWRRQPGSPKRSSTCAI